MGEELHGRPVNHLELAANGCGGRGPYTNSIVDRDGFEVCHGCPVKCAAYALIEISAERSRTTPRNGPRHFDMLPTDPLAVSLDKDSSSSADEIGNLERRWGHWSTSSAIVTHTYIKTAWQSLFRSLMRSVCRRAVMSKRR